MAEENGVATDEPVVRIYTKRLPWTPAVSAGLLFAVVGFAMTRSVLVCGARGCVSGPFAGAACIVLGVPVALIGLYYVCTPVPLLCLNQTGVFYRVFPFYTVRVRWDDVQLIRAYSQITIMSFRRDPQLDVTMRFTSRAINANGGRSALFWHFSGADLPLPPQQLIELIRRFHPVQYVDRGEQDSTKFHPLIRRSKPSRQARWSARHRAETSHQYEGADDR